MFNLFAMLLSSSLSLAAQPVGEPANWCAGSCSEPQQKIEEQFQAARFEPAQTEPSLYSGDCYHSGYGMDKTHAHKGAFYFSSVDHDDGSQPIHMSGVFGFFNKGYEDMTIEEAQQRFTKHSEPKHAMIPLEISYLNDFSMDGEIVRYWFRHSADLNTIYLLGQWGYEHFVFCEVKRNAHLTH